jgi:hypothetical protein
MKHKKGLMQALVALNGVKIEFACIMLTLPVKHQVHMRITPSRINTNHSCYALLQHFVNEHIKTDFHNFSLLISVKMEPITIFCT